MSDTGPVTREIAPAAGVRWHEYADIFPWMGDADRTALLEDIKLNGVQEPIVFLGESILDGRNRYECARSLGIEYPRCDYTGSDPLAFVISKNLKRRHLTESQRAMVAAKIAKMPAHRPEKGANLPPSSQQAAAMMNVSERSVKTAKAVERSGIPELVEAVEKGEVKVSTAVEVASRPKEEQQEIVAKGPSAVKEAAKESRRNKRASINTESHSKEDRGVDLYETPAIAMKVLLMLETFSNTVWEPACGKGAIVRELQANGYSVVASDLCDYGIEGQQVEDFLESGDKAPGCDIVTNPPYGVADKFVSRAVLEFNAQKVAMLLRVNFLAGCNDIRKSIMDGPRMPARVHVFSRRLPMMHRDGWDGPESSSSMDLAWFVWDRSHIGPTIVRRHDWKDYE